MFGRRRVRRILEAHGVRFDGGSIAMEMPRELRPLSKSRLRQTQRELAFEPAPMTDALHVAFQIWLDLSNHGHGEPGASAKVAVWLRPEQAERVEVVLGDQVVGWTRVDGQVAAHLRDLAKERVHADGTMSFHRAADTSNWHVEVDELVCALPE